MKEHAQRRPQPEPRPVPEGEPRRTSKTIANWLCPLLAQHDVLLDLHSFNAATASPS
jgi:hypothetical protein